MSFKLNDTTQTEIAEAIDKIHKAKGKRKKDEAWVDFWELLTEKFDSTFWSGFNYNRGSSK